MSMGTWLEKADLKSNRAKQFIFVVVIAIVAISWLGIFDKLSSDYIDGSLVQASVAFAMARLFNAIISVMQSTTVEVVFFSVSVGEVLDPINDLVEQYSSLMKLAIGSLVIQKLLITIVSDTIFKIGITVMGMWLLLCTTVGYESWQRLATKAFATFVFLRFALVLIFLMNGVVDRLFIQDVVQQDIAEMERYPAELQRIEEQRSISLELERELEEEKLDLTSQLTSLQAELAPLDAQRIQKEAETSELEQAIEAQRRELTTTQRLNVFYSNESLTELNQTLDVLRTELREINQQIREVNQATRAIEEDISAIDSTLAGEAVGFMSGVSQRVSSLTNAVTNIREQFSPSNIMERTSDMVDTMLRSMAIFIFRTLILPLLFLLILVKGFKVIWNVDLKKIYDQRTKSTKSTEPEAN